MATKEQEFHAADEPEETGTELVPALAVAGDATTDIQIATAKRFPRSISKFRKEAEAMALLDEETAAECFYALPRGGKTIEGPSARLAEIVLYAWGNARADAEVVDAGPTHLTSRGTFFDLERNVAVRVSVQRRITDKHGRRYNDDMIGVTGNAANSIALRNAVLKGVPKALWKRIYEQARVASLGKGGTLTQKRQAMLDWYGKLGVEPARVFELLGVDGIEDVKEDQLITLRGLANAIRDGETTVEEAFARAGSVDTGATRDLNEKLRAKAEGQKPAEATGEKAEPTAADLKAVAEAKRRAAQAFADAEPDGELPFGDPKPRRRAAQLEE